MSPEEHDGVLAATSHLPHVAAWALARAVAVRRGTGPDPLHFSGPSLRDMTRIAGASVEMWRDILLANGAAVMREIGIFRDELDEMAAAIEKRDGARLEAVLGGAREFRLALEREAGQSVEPARGPLLGVVRIPGDKSIGHRSLILGALAEGVTEIRGLSPGEDNASTLSVLGSLGVRASRDGDRVTIEGVGAGGLQAPTQRLDCGNSGTTIRMMCGVLAGRSFEVTLDGDDSLRRRPMERVAAPLRSLGAVIETTDGCPPVRIGPGRLRAGRVELDVASAQVKTAVLLAGLQAQGKTTVVEPATSRDHTERLLPMFGVEVERPDARTSRVRGPAVLRAASVDVPGDPSAAAFWLVAGSIVPGSRLELRGVSMNPTRTGALDVLLAMGARIEIRRRPPAGREPVADLVVEASELRGIEVVGETMLRAIDEFPALAVAAAVAHGQTRFADGAELRVKESDRIAAMAAGLGDLGVDVEESADGMIVRGGAELAGGAVDACGDHRIAMAFAVAALVARRPVRIRGAGVMAVSDPGFLASLERVRGGAS